METTARSNFREALALAERIDEVYYSLYAKRAELSQGSALGVPGKCSFLSIAQVLNHVKLRQCQIEALRTEIDRLINGDGSEELAEIKRIALEVEA